MIALSTSIVSSAGCGEKVEALKEAESEVELDMVEKGFSDGYHVAKSKEELYNAGYDEGYDAGYADFVK